MKQKNKIIKPNNAQPQNITNQQIRLELNEAKWIAIWTPSHSKVKAKDERRIERKINDTNTQAITIFHVSNIGTLTTEDLRTYLVLILLWEKNGRHADKPVPFSLAQLAHIMGITWRAKTALKLRQSLRRLLIVPMEWENAFYHKPSNRIIVNYSNRHILSQLSFAEKREKGKKISDQEQGAFKFDQHVIDNLLANYSKPLYLDDALAITDELAFLLFMHLDIVMANKQVYVCNSAKLFQELGLHERKMYQYPSGRKQVLLSAIKQLLGKRLSTGVIKNIDLLQNIPASDYKLSVRKGALQQINVAPIKTQPKDPASVSLPPIEPPTPFTDEQQILFSQLQKAFLVTSDTAARLVTHHLQAAKQQLAAWPFRDHSQIQDKSSWIIRAIERAYELPQAYLDLLKHQQQQEMAKRLKATISACDLCDDTGMRTINHQGNRCAKRCSHDPVIESTLPNYY